MANLAQKLKLEEPVIEFVPYKGRVVTDLGERIRGMTQSDISALVQLHRARIGQEIPNLGDLEYEGIYTLEDITYDKGKDTTTLCLGLTTGTMAKALQNVYKGQAPDQNPIAIQGMIITSDGKIVMGVRSKLKFRADKPDEPFDYKLLFCPAGYAKLSSRRNSVLENSFYSELEEEMNMGPNDLNEVKLMGHNRDFGFTEGTRITYLARTNLDFQSVVERWETAPHFWEHTGLIGLPNNPDEIKKFLTSTDFSQYSRDAKGMINSCVRPVLSYYAENFSAFSRN